MDGITDRATAKPSGAYRRDCSLQWVFFVGEDRHEQVQLTGGRRQRKKKEVVERRCPKSRSAGVGYTVGAGLVRFEGKVLG